MLQFSYKIMNHNQAYSLTELGLYPVDLSLAHFLSRAPNDTQFAHLGCTRTDFHPFQGCHVRGVDPLNLLVRGVFTR